MNSDDEPAKVDREPFDNERDDLWLKLMMACEDGDVLSAKEALSVEKYRKDILCLCCNETQEAETAILHAACFDQAAPVIQLMLDYGDNPNKEDWNGSTALMNACMYGNKKNVEILLARGADPLRRDGNAFYLAEKYAKRNQKEIIDLLRKHVHQRLPTEAPWDT